MPYSTKKPIVPIIGRRFGFNVISQFQQTGQGLTPIGIYWLSKVLVRCSSDDQSGIICAILKRILPHLLIATELNILDLEEALLFSTLELINSSQDAKRTFLLNSGIRIYSAILAFEENGVSSESIVVTMETIVSILNDED